MLTGQIMVVVDVPERTRADLTIGPEFDKLAQVATQVASDARGVFPPDRLEDAARRFVRAIRQSVEWGSIVWQPERRGYRVRHRQTRRAYLVSWSVETGPALRADIQRAAG